MNYEDVYDCLITRAVELRGHPLNARRTTPRPAPFMLVHHIVPVSWWATPEQGTRAIRNDHEHEANQPGNLVWLTPREHWIAHLCLAKTYGGKEWIAVEKMASGINDAAPGIRPNSRLVEAAVIRGREANRRISKAKAELDPHWGTRHLTAEIIKRRTESIRKAWTPEMRERARLESGHLHSPAVSAKRAASLQSDKYRTAKREETAANWNDPEVRAARIAGQKKRFAEPDHKARRAEIARERWASGSLTAPKPANAIVAVNVKTGEETHYASTTEAKKAGFNEGNVFQVLTGAKRTSKGHYWRWATESSESHQARIAALQPKHIYIGTPVAGGEEIRLEGMDAIREGGFNQPNITACCKGRIKSHKGYRWRYADSQA